MLLVSLNVMYTVIIPKFLYDLYFTSVKCFVIWLSEGEKPFLSHPKTNFASLLVLWSAQNSDVANLFLL